MQSGAIPFRDTPRDALIIKVGLPYITLDGLPYGAVVGTSSVRRSAQLKRLHPYLDFANIRGNVETRLEALDKTDSEFTCIVVYACGLERIGLSDRLTQYLSARNRGIYHAVGQGALGLEIRKGDVETMKLIQSLVYRVSMLVSVAERELLRTLEGGCSVPIGVESEWLNEAAGYLELRAIIASLDGTKAVDESLTATVLDEAAAEALGRELAAKLLASGAGSILDDIKANRPAKN
jgi:hydroxymethylbilane synthase